MLTLRELTPKDDFEAVGQIYAASWKAAYRGLMPQHYLDKLTGDRWSAMLRAEPSNSIVLYADHKAIGTASVGFSRDPEREGFGEVVSIYLMPGYTGHGFGRMLMKAALHKLKEQGCADACLWALNGNTTAEGFYKHMGFKRTGRVQNELFGGESLALCEYHVKIDESMA